MKKTLTSAALFALLVLLAVPQTKAQAQIELGPRVGYDIDQLEELSIGADLRVSTIALPVQINGTFDYYLLGDEYGGLDVFRFTANGLYQFGIDNQYFTPYAGPGLSLTRLSINDDGSFGNVNASETELGLNLVGGAQFSVGALKPFAQAEFVVGGDYEPVQITGGLLFTISGN